MRASLLVTAEACLALAATATPMGAAAPQGGRIQGRTLVLDIPQ